ncbi:hypothetical protein [Parasphingorhabdus sp.]|uniref:hypothetical protein n=1 Tax=Parasphingorhabdus sp. TaxID=2709688 RepID=UPI003594541E
MTIAVSLAMLSGMAMGHATEQSMYARLSAHPPPDPVERFALGRNAYQPAPIHAKERQARPVGYAPEYADASDTIGRYEKGARILTAAEPARKIERLRLERLQAWNDENFGTGVELDDEPVDYAERDMDDHAPIDIGAVIDAPESAARPVIVHIGTDGSGIKGGRAE